MRCKTVKSTSELKGFTLEVNYGNHVFCISSNILSIDGISQCISVLTFAVVVNNVFYSRVVFFRIKKPLHKVLAVVEIWEEKCVEWANGKIMM